METRKSERPKAKPDVNQSAAAMVAAITGQPLPSGEELLGSEELRKQLREAKEADKVRTNRH